MDLGVTHLANGCYREHSIERSVGEVGSLPATRSVDRKLVPQ